LSNENWRTIEVAYGHSIPREARAHIEVVTSRFLQMSLAENIGSMEDATKRANQLRQRAQALLTTIAAPPVGNGIRDYTDDELALSYARLNSGNLGKILRIRAAPLARCKYMSEVYAYLGWRTPAATVRNHHKIIWSTQFRRDSRFSGRVTGN
jgi:monoamine oxidase